MLDRVEPLRVLEVHELDELLLGVEEHLRIVLLLVAQSGGVSALVSRGRAIPPARRGGSCKCDRGCGTAGWRYR